MKKIFLILFILVQAACSQSDEAFEPTLPPITQTGENTFGCYANGILITPRDGRGTFNSFDHGLIFWGNPNGPTDYLYHEIDVHDYASEKTAKINLHILNLFDKGEGTYIVNESNCYDGIDSPNTNNIFCRVWDYEDNIYESYCSFENSGVIHITKFDLEKRIVSGTFHCKVVSYDDPTDTIEITEGRFDIKWDHLPSNFP